MATSEQPYGTNAQEYKSTSTAPRMSVTTLGSAMSECISLPELPVLLHFGRRAAFESDLDPAHEDSSNQQSSPKVVPLRDRKNQSEAGAKRRKARWTPYKVTQEDRFSNAEAKNIWQAEAPKPVGESDAQKHLESLSQVYRSAFDFRSSAGTFTSAPLGESINCSASAGFSAPGEPAEHGTPARCESAKTQPESCCELITERDVEANVKPEPEAESERYNCQCWDSQVAYSQDGVCGCASESECDSNCHWTAGGRSAFVRVSRDRRAAKTCQSASGRNSESGSCSTDGAVDADGGRHVSKASEPRGHPSSRSSALNDNFPRRSLAERRSQMKQLQRQRSNLHAYLRAFLSDEQIEFMENTAPLTKRRTVNRPSYGWSWDTLRIMTKLFTQIGHSGYVYLKTVAGLPLPHINELRRLRTGYQLGAIPDDDSRPSAAASHSTDERSQSPASLTAYAVQPCLTTIRISGGLPVAMGNAYKREFAPRARWTRRRAAEPGAHKSSPKWSRNGARRLTPSDAGCSTPERQTLSPLVRSNAPSNGGVPEKSRAECGLVGVSVPGKTPKESRRTEGKAARAAAAAASTDDDALVLQPIRVEQLTLNVQQLFAVDD